VCSSRLALRSLWQFHYAVCSPYGHAGVAHFEYPFAVVGGSKMELEIPIALIVGFAAGYAVRAVISFVRRRKAYRLRHAEALRAAEASNNFDHVQRPAR